MSSDCWFTPPDLFEQIEAEHGPFDLDPAADPRADVWGRIPNHWTVDDDGLSKPWHGRVFVNPPYSRVRPWVEKAIEEVVHARRATRVAMLVNACTDTAWWWRAIDTGAAPTFLRGRVQFLRPDGEIGGSPRYGSAVLVWRSP